jgi:ribonuclease III
MQPCLLKSLKNNLNRERQLNQLMTTLGFSFNSPQLLAEALVHSSYANEQSKTKTRHNERLEFLGDAVLDLVVSDWLFRGDADMDEGTMTQARASVVCERSLAIVAERIRLGDYLMLGYGERSKDGNYPASILADAFEALIGAIYLDCGLENVREFIERMLKDALLMAQSGCLIQDFKSQLQQELQKEGPRTIIYQLVAQAGPPHNRTFSVEVWVDGEVLGSGAGKSKKEAEQAAAQAAIEAGF